MSLASIASALVDALDPDAQDDGGAADVRADRRTRSRPTSRSSRRREALEEGGHPAALARPALRKLLLDLRQKFEQIIDEVSKDDAALDQPASAPRRGRRRGRWSSRSSSYLAEHKDEIDALQFFYSVPHRKRLRFTDIKALAAAIKAPPRSWTPEKLWRAYETLEKDKVRGASGERLLTDIVSLVRFALHQDGELVPHAERVRERFETWMAQQANEGRTVHRGAAALAGDDARPRRDESGDRHRGLRLTSVRAGGRASAGAQVFGKELESSCRS